MWRAKKKKKKKNCIVMDNLSNRICEAVVESMNGSYGIKTTDTGNL